MFGIGTTELIVVAGIVILLFGGKKLPQLGRSMGSAITNFKKGLNEPDSTEKKVEAESEAETKKDNSTPS